MKIEIITSFNQAYYDKIGKDAVSTWLEYWPLELTLTCYVEEFKLPDHPRIKQISFENLPIEYTEFQQDSNLKRRVKLFAKKAYSIIHAFKNSDADRIIWLDADVLSLDSIPLEIIKDICPNDALIAYMQVWHNEEKGNKESKLFSSAESGVFVVNTNHKKFKKFADRYTAYYNKRIQENLRRFYDGDVLGAVVKEFETDSKVIDLCADFKKPYKSPLSHTMLGNYLRHYKSKHAKDDFVNDD